MNISKNLLSLGLITIISGISTAQTYTATAGTNGVTDIQSDYSVSTGDGASVSVDVPLEFELPKKVAITVAPSGRILPSNSLFDGILPPSSSHLSSIIDLTPYPHADWSNLSSTEVTVGGGIYSNTEFSITVDATEFEHESDPNSSFKSRNEFRLGKQSNANWAEGGTYGTLTDDNDSATSVFPGTLNVDSSALIAEDNKFGFYYHSFAYLDTIDPTDRAGKYISIATITVSTL